VGVVVSAVEWVAVSMAEWVVASAVALLPAEDSVVDS